MAGERAEIMLGPYVSVYDPYGRFGALSTFAETPFHEEGLRWSSVEHYFQAQKFHDDAIRESIRALVRPSDVKALAWSKEFSPLVRTDWDNVRVDVMRHALELKFRQSPAARASLLSSWPMPIVDASTTDSFWGVGPDGMGENMLGMLLYELRGAMLPPGWSFAKGPLPANASFQEGSEVRWHLLDAEGLLANRKEVKVDEWVFEGFAKLSVPDLLHSAAGQKNRTSTRCPSSTAIDALLPEIFDAKYAGYSWFEDARCAIVDWPERFFGSLVSAGVTLPPKDSIVAVGAGAGSEASFLWRRFGARVTLVDVGHLLTENCREQAPEARVVQAKAQELTAIPDRSANLYCALRTYDAAYFDRQTALKEAHRILAPGAHLAITFSNGYLRSDGKIETGQIIDDGSLDTSAPWRLLLETVEAAAALGFYGFHLLDLDSELGFLAIAPDPTT